MISIALGFVAGAWLLQQQATLPSLIWLPIVAISLSLLTLSLRYNTATYYRLTILFVSAAMVGFFYAAWFATLRLNDALPQSWQQKDIEIIGVVARMPEVNADRERFHFDVEQVLTQDAKVPRHIGLNYYQAGAWSQKINKVNENALFRPAIFKAGERWRLTVRLKRPHATLNPHGYDFEAWAFANNIRALGSIQRKREMEKLSGFVWRPRYMVEYCRERVGNRINQVLMHQPYAGVIRGLVIGEDSEITPENWDVYLRTGTNHLMSMSYPLKRHSIVT